MLLAVPHLLVTIFGACTCLYGAANLTRSRSYTDDKFNWLDQYTQSIRKWFWTEAQYLDKYGYDSKKFGAKNIKAKIDSLKRSYEKIYQVVSSSKLQGDATNFSAFIHNEGSKATKSLNNLKSLVDGKKDSRSKSIYGDIRGRIDHFATKQDEKNEFSYTFSDPVFQQLDACIALRRAIEADPTDPETIKNAAEKVYNLIKDDEHQNFIDACAGLKDTGVIDNKDQLLNNLGSAMGDLQQRVFISDDYPKLEGTDYDVTAELGAYQSAIDAMFGLAIDPPDNAAEDHQSFMHTKLEEAKGKLKAIIGKYEQAAAADIDGVGSEPSKLKVNLLLKLSSTQKKVKVKDETYTLNPEFKRLEYLYNLNLILGSSGAVDKKALKDASTQGIFDEVLQDEFFASEYTKVFGGDVKTFFQKWKSVVDAENSDRITQEMVNQLRSSLKPALDAKLADTKRQADLIFPAVNRNVWSMQDTFNLLISPSVLFAVYHAYFFDLARCLKSITGGMPFLIIADSINIADLVPIFFRLSLSNIIITRLLGSEYGIVNTGYDLFRDFLIFAEYVSERFKRNVIGINSNPKYTNWSDMQGQMRTTWQRGGIFALQIFTAFLLPSLVPSAALYMPAIQVATYTFDFFNADAVFLALAPAAFTIIGPATVRTWNNTRIKFKEIGNFMFHALAWSAFTGLGISVLAGGIALGGTFSGMNILIGPVIIVASAVNFIIAAEGGWAIEDVLWAVAGGLVNSVTTTYKAGIALTKREWENEDLKLVLKRMRQGISIATAIGVGLAIWYLCFPAFSFLGETALSAVATETYLGWTASWIARTGQAVVGIGAVSLAIAELRNAYDGITKDCMNIENTAISNLMQSIANYMGFALSS